MLSRPGEWCLWINIMSAQLYASPSGSYQGILHLTSFISLTGLDTLWVSCTFCGLKLSFLWWSSLWCLLSHTQSPSLLQSCYWSSSTTSHTNTLLSTSSKHIKINRGKYNLLTKFVYITCSNLFCLLPVSQKFTVAQSGS